MVELSKLKSAFKFWLFKQALAQIMNSYFFSGKKKWGKWLAKAKWNFVHATTIQKNSILVGCLIYSCIHFIGFMFMQKQWAINSIFSVTFVKLFRYSTVQNSTSSINKNKTTSIKSHHTV